MAALTGQHLVKAGDRLLVATQRLEGDATIIERADVVGPDRERLLEARQRFLVPFERVEDHAVVRQRGRGFGIGFERGCDQPQGFHRVALLVLEHPAEMQRIELPGIGPQDGSVDALRLRQFPLLMQRQRLRDRRRRAARGRPRPVTGLEALHVFHLVHELLSNATENALPIAGLRLAEQPRAKIPGRILALEQPAKIGRERQQRPNRFAERAGEMHHRSIHRDHQIEELDHRRRIGKIGELIADHRHIGMGAQRGAFGGIQVLLETHELHVRHRQQCGEALEGDRPVAIVLVRRAPLPDDADSHALQLA